MSKYGSKEIDKYVTQLFRAAASGDLAAREQLESIAQSGDHEAEYLMGRLHDPSMEGRDNCETTNCESAKRWYERAANGGVSMAQYCLADMHYRGDGMERDDGLARLWFEKAAHQGVTDAQLHLGNMLKRGQGGYQSNDEAAYWFREAASLGDELAATNLGLMHYAGEINDANDREAFALFSFSAEKLDGLAHLMLGDMYLAERGVSQDVRRALLHYCIASLLLKEDQKKQAAVDRMEEIISLNPHPQLRARVTELALDYIRKRGLGPIH